MRQIKLIIAALLILGPFAAHADIIFDFQVVSGRVTMISSGTLDTSNLIQVFLDDGWGNTGTEDNPAAGDIDIMGGTSFGQIDTQFGFSAGTDVSAITNPGGPFAFSNFSNPTIAGSHSFTTYSGFQGAGFTPPRLAGIGVIAADMVGALWTPDQTWTYAIGDTFASLGLNVGTYSVSDFLTGETITIRIGRTVPEPATLAILGLGLAGMGLARRRKKA